MCAAAGSRKANGGAHQSPNAASRVAAVDLLNPLIFFKSLGDGKQENLISIPIDCMHVRLLCACCVNISLRTFLFPFFVLI